MSVAISFRVYSSGRGDLPTFLTGSRVLLG